MTYQPTGYPLKIFKDRYAFTSEETWVEACLRLSRQMALAETPDKQKIYEAKFNEILESNLFVPGGRIWYNSGRNNPQLLNCFVLDPNKDSKEGWGNSAKNMIITSMANGGVGDDFSDVRPRGALITSQRGECPGPVELMRLQDGCAKPVRAGGQRRVAQMFSLDLDHPDIIEFLDAKLELGQLTSANISVRSKRTKDFIKAIEKDLDWELSWKGKYKKVTKARELWEKITRNAYNSAEPGFLNWELVSNESNIYYIEDLVTTNPCQPAFAKLTLASGKETTMGELKEGDILLNKENKETIVLKKWSTGVKKVYAYAMNGGTFIGTENHKVVALDYNKNETKIEIKNCYEFDYLIKTIRGFEFIQDVIYLGEYEVFDINVSDDTHTYLTNGVYVSNCGEIALSAFDCCCLGHIVLPRFVSSDGSVDYSRLGNTIRTAVRFLDNVLTVNSYPLPEMKDKSHKLRRIGLGTTGLADALVLMGSKYGSEEGYKTIDKLYRFISKAAYESSVMLAIEKGAFPACNPTKHIESGFMKRMPAKIKSLVLEHGIRNCAILTQAPTGTVSILSGNCSSGIEPMFAPAYERRYWDKDERKTEIVFHPLYAQFLKENKKTDIFVSSRELSIREHMETQKIIQKHVDNAVSKTINIAEDTSIEEVSKLWLEYLPHLKGTTFYRENTRGYVDEKGVVHEPPLKALSFSEAKSKFSENVKEEGLIDCNSGVCSI